MSATGLSHFDAQGQAHMVDVADKGESRRRALAAGRIAMQPSTLATILAGEAGKGDVLGVARIAGIQAAKRTGELIPLCHPITITRVALAFDADPDHGTLRCEATVETIGRTGVEMEALTAVAIALLTVYDMCKSMDRAMVIEDVRLLAKSGGRSGSWQASEHT
ncbi:MAG: cyclic pyranopterin monophosphate synthase accessory protein 3 [Betaproteobacteria bacterium]|nr:cyclic pyranopterin monophosphate synthase MoaC [Rhodocyclaceae bacterium]MCG3186638.1 Cyclic pyranopterin monophosphate synthase [Rhodocyclaceae bacterium]